MPIIHFLNDMIKSISTATTDTIKHNYNAKFLTLATHSTGESRGNTTRTVPILAVTIVVKPLMISVAAPVGNSDIDVSPIALWLMVNISWEAVYRPAEALFT